MSQTIERDSPVPYYDQLFTILRGRISGGTIAADERLPSEHELCREFGLSRGTVRQTLLKLESEGYARRVARRGIFASAPEESSGWVVEDPLGFFESQLRHGHTGISTEVLDARFGTPPQHVADALHLELREETFALQRLRSLNGRIALFSTNWFPSHVGRTIAAASDVLEGTGSVNTTLRNAGFRTVGARRIIRAMRAPELVARHLRVDPEQPVMRVRSVSWDQEEVNFDYYETWVLTDVVPLEVHVVAS